MPANRPQSGNLGQQWVGLFGQKQAQPQSSGGLFGGGALFNSVPEQVPSQPSGLFGGPTTTPLVHQPEDPSSGILQSKPAQSVTSGAEPTRAKSPGKENEPEGPHLKHSFLDLLQTGKYSDYTIMTDTHKWNVHMAILASKAGDLVPKDAAPGGTVNYKRWDRIIMDRVVEFIYSGDYDTYVEPNTFAEVSYGTTIDALKKKKKLPLRYHLFFFAAGIGYSIPGLAELALEKVKQHFEGSEFVEAEARSCYIWNVDMAFRSEFHPYWPDEFPMTKLDTRMCNCLKEVAIAQGVSASLFHA
ncbi:uncharacterized protein BDZ99DRAFT_462972 [Mytilinidion resinicola]|uniref:BTB domain-containing protein n=1 Tax=Mytilinidion resinicola TaxID=574789 RepID=A0A6A6YPE9_9PEZI|nr:uncharacterized protein BDZ99DRAFT_462972 [Mytilinidion resinicola]KAF2810398.1 hypothetical protein BDZ99DRAFT_462972 [Mytilinidion resinicola]